MDMGRDFPLLVMTEGSGSGRIVDDMGFGMAFPLDAKGRRAASVEVDGMDRMEMFFQERGKFKGVHSFRQTGSPSIYHDENQVIVRSKGRRGPRMPDALVPEGIFITELFDLLL